MPCFDTARVLRRLGTVLKMASKGSVMRSSTSRALAPSHSVRTSKVGTSMLGSRSIDNDLRAIRPKMITARIRITAVIGLLSSTATRDYVWG